MANVAKIDMEQAQSSVKRITESLERINTEAEKLVAQYAEASDATNLNAVKALEKPFTVVAEAVAKMTTNVQEVYEATRKYVEQVAEIDAEDNSIFN